MASREPMWFCHECSAEMRPLMMPDPHCAVCRGTFVEKIENPQDDPRQYHHAPLDADPDDQPFNPLDLLMGLQSVMGEGRSGSPRTRDRPRSPQFTSTSSSFTFRFDNTGNGPPRFSTSSSRSPPTRSDSVPPLFGMGARRDRREEGDITGPLMFQYLAALLSQPGRDGAPGNPMMAHLFGQGAEPGRMGDYVFSQEALDQILTQLMEHSSSHPVPATEEIMQNLPKIILEEGSPLLEKDCAVCKEQFQLGTEDPAEQIVVTLPCKHPFHEGCIMPWLKSSATCPVCRHELVPQPRHHGPGEGPSGRPDASGPNGAPGSPPNPFSRFGGAANPGSGANNGQRSGGLLGILESFMNGGAGASSSNSGGGGNNTSNAGRTPGGGSHSRANSDPNIPGNRPGNSRRSSSSSDGSGRSGHIPGSWSDVD